MIIDDLLRSIKPENIDLAPYETMNGCIIPNGTMFITNTAPLEEQVLTVLHELLHLHPLFFPYTQQLWTGKIQRNEQIEEEITRKAEETYIEKQYAVKYIMSLLEKAAKLPINKK